MNKTKKILGALVVLAFIFTLSISAYAYLPEFVPGPGHNQYCNDDTLAFNYSTGQCEALHYQRDIHVDVNECGKGVGRDSAGNVLWLDDSAIMHSKDSSCKGYYTNKSPDYQNTIGKMTVNFSINREHTKYKDNANAQYLLQPQVHEVRWNSTWHYQLTTSKTLTDNVNDGASVADCDERVFDRMMDDSAPLKCIQGYYWKPGERDYIVPFLMLNKKEGYRLEKSKEVDSVQAGHSDMYRDRYYQEVDTNALGMTYYREDGDNGESTHIDLSIEPNAFKITFDKGKTDDSAGDYLNWIQYEGIELYDIENTPAGAEVDYESKFITKNLFKGRSYDITLRAKGGEFDDGNTTKHIKGNLPYDKSSTWSVKVSNTSTKQWEERKLVEDINTLRTEQGESVDATAIWKEKSISNLPEPTREGYVFVGWRIADDKDPTDKVSYNTDTETVTVKPHNRAGKIWLEAIWKACYVEDYYLNTPNSCSTRSLITGKADVINNNKKVGTRIYNKPTKRAEGKQVTTWTPNWTVPGYHYKDGCWYIKEDDVYYRLGEFGTRYKSDETECSHPDDTEWVRYPDETFTGRNPKHLKWYTEVVANGYTIKYNKNQPGNSFDFSVQGTVPDQTATFDQYVYLSNGGYTCVGYDLVGWSTTPGTYEQQMSACGNYKGNSYSRGSATEAANLNLSHYCRNLGGWNFNNETVNLYAIWKPIPYKVVYTKGSSGNISTTAGANIISNTASSRFGTTNDPGELYYPVWSKSFKYFNNTPQLSATRDGDGIPNFTSEGYYIDYWTVKSITGTRETSRDTTGQKIETLTGYTTSDTTTSGIVTFLNLCAPKAHDCVVTLEAHWAPIRYKVRYNNDTTVPVEQSVTPVDRKYTFSNQVVTSKAKKFGKDYKLQSFNPTRSNKYGKSLFLGYCFVNGDTSKLPTYVVNGKTPKEYMNKPGVRTTFNAFDWGRPLAAIDVGNQAAGKKNCPQHPDMAVTGNGIRWDAYFKYPNEGAIQSFDLFAVWDDCPGIEPIDVEQQRGSTASDFKKSTAGLGAITKSGSDLEYKILMLQANTRTLWDREDENQTFTNPATLSKKYYLDNFKLLNMNEDPEDVTSYELRYTIVDDNGNKYATSRKLYSGFFKNIKVEDEDLVKPFEH